MEHVVNLATWPYHMPDRSRDSLGTRLVQAEIATMGKTATRHNSVSDAGLRLKLLWASLYDL